MKKILMIGGGGIGSYLAREIHRLILNGQIDLKNTQFTIADFDNVEEKNIKYQNFEPKDVFKKKSKSLSTRYCFLELPEKITSGKQLTGFDLIIVAADNAIIRDIVSDYCYTEHPESDFIDLRCEGRAVSFFTKSVGIDAMKKSIGEIKYDSGHSCQLDYELRNGIIQNGNIIASAIGSQLLLNWLRGQTNPPSMIFRI